MHTGAGGCAVSSQLTSGHSPTLPNRGSKTGELEMKTKVIIASFVAATLGVPATAGEGRYTILGTSVPAVVWVLDTLTGQVKMCTSALADKAAKCNLWSDK